jgi:hypothetical protein
MLSATPVNNRLRTSRTRSPSLPRATTAHVDHGIPSIEVTSAGTAQFNRWLKLPSRTPHPKACSMDMLGFDYFKLLDLLTIARSRKHIEKYYDTAEIGKFPER